MYRNDKHQVIEKSAKIIVVYHTETLSARGDEAQRGRDLVGGALRLVHLAQRSARL